MFMSTVVYFVEFLVVSLTVMMLYKLFISYKNWKMVSAFSAKPAIKKAAASIDLIAENSSSSLIPERDSDYLLANKICVSEAESKPVFQEIKPASILDDYIGGFFTETKSVDIDAYRSDDAIKVQRRSLYKTSVMNKDSDPVEQSSSKSKDFTEMEADSFITVASVNDEQKDSNKIMSDKVVLAMLDEAKLVCAS